MSGRPAFGHGSPDIGLFACGDSETSKTSVFSYFPETIVTEEYGDEGWTDSSRIEFEYDEHGRPLVATTYTAEVDGWTPLSRISHTYVEDQLVSSLSERYQDGWNLTAEEDYTYTANAFELESIRYSRPAPGADDRATLARDEAGRLVSSTWETYQGEEPNGSFALDRRVLYEYVANDELALSRSDEEQYSGDDWDSVARSEYSYGPDGLVQRQTTANYEASSWVERFRDDFVFAPDGHLQRVDKQELVSDSWGPASREEFEYSEDGRLETWTQSVFNESSSAYEPSSRKSYTFVDRPDAAPGYFDLNKRLAPYPVDWFSSLCLWGIERGDEMQR